MNPRRTSFACAVVAALLLVAGVLLWFSNPAVDVAATDYGFNGPAGEIGCSIAPWDAGRNGNRDTPGGEHLAPYSAEVATECYSANIRRYNAAIGSGVLAFLVLVGGVAVAVWPRRPVVAPA